MSAIPQFSAPQSPFVGPDGRLTFAGNVFLRDLWLRVGGANGLSNTELLELIELLQLEDIALDLRIDALEATIGSWTEVEIDFGTKPVYSAQFTLTAATITAASTVQVLPCGKPATGRTADDWAFDGATFAAVPGTGSAVCYAVFSPGPIVGPRKVQYLVGV